MQRPLFVDAPRSTDDLRTAFSFYYKGISLDFSPSGPLGQALRAYVDFRQPNGLDDGPARPGRTTLKVRQEEEALLDQMLSDYDPHGKHCGYCSATR